MWGVQTMNCIESVHTYACKRFLRVPTNSSNDAVLGDLGRYPIFINAAKRCIKYWLKIIRLPRSRYVRLCYEMLVHYDNIGHINWVTNVRNHLFLNGFGYVWLQQSVGDEKLFLANYFERLKNQYSQIWHMNCNNNRKLIVYKDFKDTFGREFYVSIIDVGKFRTALAKLRCSSHNLMIEYGYYNIAIEERLCVYCETITEDEYHFLMICPLYAELRNKFISQHFTNNACMNSFYRLMKCENETQIKNLAMFVYYAFVKKFCAVAFKKDKSALTV